MGNPHCSPGAHFRKPAMFMITAPLQVFLSEPSISR